MHKTNVLLALWLSACCAQRTKDSNWHSSAQRRDAYQWRQAGFGSPLQVLARIFLVDSVAAFNAAQGDRLGRWHEPDTSQALKLRGRGCSSRRAFISEKSALALAMATAGSAPALALGSDVFGKDPNDIFGTIQQQTYERVQCKSRGLLGACTETEPLQKKIKKAPVFADDKELPPAPAPSPEEMELARLQAELEGLEGVKAPMPAPAPRPAKKIAVEIEGIPLISNEQPRELDKKVNRTWINELLQASSDPELKKIEERDVAERMARVSLTGTLGPFSDKTAVMKEDGQLDFITYPKYERLKKRGKVIRSTLGTGMDVYVPGFDPTAPEPEEKKLFGIFR